MKNFVSFLSFQFILLALCAFSLTAQAEDLADALAKMHAQIQSDAVPAGPFSANVVVCEQFRHKILILKPGTDWNQPESVVWEWSPEMSPQIRPEHSKWFRHPDECKPTRGTTHLLMTASGGGIALIRLADKACLFYAHIEGNPHSIELLPDGNIVSISSGGLFTIWPVPEGNDAINADSRLEPNPRGRQYPTIGGHGCVWDEELQILWVLGYTELAGYKYNFNKKDPQLAKEFSIPVAGTPAAGGHDLYPVPNQRALFVTGVGVGVFDIQKKEFTWLLPPDSTPAEKRYIKSISQSPEGTLIIQAPTMDYWSDRIPFFNDQLTPVGTLKDAKIYKARWWVEKWK